MAASGEARGRGSRRKGAKAGAAPKRAGGRPQRLAHLVAGNERGQRLERAALAAIEPSRPLPARTHAADPRPSPDAQALSGLSADVLCLPNPEWLPHELTVSGPAEALADFRRAAAGQGTIPWITDHGRVEEDWVHALLTPPPAERGISVEGARVLARRLRELIEAWEAAAHPRGDGDPRCPFDLHALVPVPDRALRLGPDDPAAIAWLWERWGTTWALRGVEELSGEAVPPPAEGRARVRYRFWSAD